MPREKGGNIKARIVNVVNRYLDRNPVRGYTVTRTGRRKFGLRYIATYRVRDEKRKKTYKVEREYGRLGRPFWSVW